jgi:hypothetical protein
VQSTGVNLYQNYYYYIQAKDDGALNEIHPGVPLVSSKFFTMTDAMAYLRSVIEPGVKSDPLEFSLQQNYPNPFNPSTTIPFSIPSRSTVSLKVFDLAGKEVMTILTEELSAGSYSHQWSAGDLPSGIYFFRLQAGSLIDTRKLVLVR